MKDHVAHGCTATLSMGAPCASSLQRASLRSACPLLPADRFVLAAVGASASRDLSAWRALPVSAFASRKPVAITDLAPEHLRRVLAKCSHRCFPMIIRSDVRGVVTRVEVERALRMGTPPEMENPIVFRAEQTLQEIEGRVIQSNTGLFLVSGTEGGAVTGVFTLHDLLRAQAALLE